MKKLDTKSINGIGWVVAFIWLILMFAVGVTPSQASQEKKDDSTQEDVFEAEPLDQYKDKFISEREREDSYNSDNQKDELIKEEVYISDNKSLNESLVVKNNPIVSANKNAKRKVVKTYSFDAKITSVKDQHGDELPLFEGYNVDPASGEPINSYYASSEHYDESSTIYYEAQISMNKIGENISLEDFDPDMVFIDNGSTMVADILNHKISSYDTDNGVLKGSFKYVVKDYSKNQPSTEYFMLKSKNDTYLSFSEQTKSFISFYDSDSQDEGYVVYDVDEYLKSNPDSALRHATFRHKIYRIY